MIYFFHVLDVDPKFILLLLKIFNVDVRIDLDPITDRKRRNRDWNLRDYRDSE